MRVKIGFSNSEIMVKVAEESAKNNLSKSQFIENVVQLYFKHHTDEKVTLGFGKYFRKGERLQANFKNEKTINLIKEYAEKYKTSKSQLIEFILNKHLNSQNTNNKNKKVSKFQKNIFGRIFYFYNENGRRKPEELLINSSLNIVIRSRSLSLSDLNKSYLKEIKTDLVFTLTSELTNKKENFNGFYYLVLVNEAKLVSKKAIIKENKDKTKTINKNEYIYNFKINYMVVKVARITYEKNNSKNLNLLIFERDGFLEKSSKYLDLNTIKYISKKKSKNYQPEDNYGGIFPEIINRTGYYYMKLFDKPKSIKQSLKKSHILKFDKKFILKQFPNASDLDNVCDIASIVNVLPIYEYINKVFLKEVVLDKA